MRLKIWTVLKFTLRKNIKKPIERWWANKNVTMILACINRICNYIVILSILLIMARRTNSINLFLKDFVYGIVDWNMTRQINVFLSIHKMVVFFDYVGFKILAISILGSIISKCLSILINAVQYEKEMREEKQNQLQNNAFRELCDFLESDSYATCFVLNGEWGAGKSYLIQDVCNDKFLRHFNKKICNISCFGLETRRDFEEALRNTVEEISSGFINTFITMLKKIPVVGDMIEVILKQSFRVGNLSRGSILIFEDFERISTVKDINAEVKYNIAFGFLNQLLETKKYKIIVVCNLSELNKMADGNRYFIEKMNSQICTMDSQVEKALLEVRRDLAEKVHTSDYSLSYYEKIILNERDHLLQIIKQAQISNYRVLSTVFRHFVNEYIYMPGANEFYGRCRLYSCLFDEVCRMKGFSIKVQDGYPFLRFIFQNYQEKNKTLVQAIILSFPYDVVYLKTPNKNEIAMQNPNSASKLCNIILKQNLKNIAIDNEHIGLLVDIMGVMIISKYPYNYMEQYAKWMLSYVTNISKEQSKIDAFLWNLYQRTEVVLNCMEYGNHDTFLDVLRKMYELTWTYPCEDEYTGHLIQTVKEYYVNLDEKRENEA